MKKIVLAVVTLLSLTACVSEREDNFNVSNEKFEKSLNKNDNNQKSDSENNDTIKVKSISEQAKLTDSDGGDPTTITPPRR